MNAADSALLTDLYQLTMLNCYRDANMQQSAVFELFVRKLPTQRGFLLAAGLEQVLVYLEKLHFRDLELAWLRDSGRFQPEFVDYLADLRFTGDVDAMPEGTVCFQEEPILRITAPLPEAQLVESRLVNIIHYQTMVASKAARCVLAAVGKKLVDFGLRRAHGAEAGLLTARASYLAGFDATATTLAGMHFGIPVLGTMAHSLIMAHDSEAQAFEHFALAQPDNVMLLIDTYDTAAAAAGLGALAQRLQQHDIAIKGVRLDSGDLAMQARDVRRILDQQGLNAVTIFASSDLDEYRLRALIDDGAPIDGFGIGTRLAISADAPSLDCVYKLQEYAGLPRRKRSPNKATWPGRKQVYRQQDRSAFSGDCLALCDDPQAGEPLLQPVMRAGQRVTSAESLDHSRRRAAAQLAMLPEHLRHNATEPAYPVVIAPRLHKLADELDRKSH